MKKRTVLLLLLSLFIVIFGTTAHAATSTQEFGPVKIHTYTTDSYANAVVVENDKLVLFDAFGNPDDNGKYKAFVDSLKKPVERIFISHADDHHWLGIDKTFPGVPLFSVDAAGIKAKPEGASLSVNSADPQSTPTVDGVKYEFVTDRTLGAWIIKLPGQKFAMVHHLGYVGVHVPIPPLDKRLAILKDLEAQGYAWFVGGHGIAMDAKTFVSEVGAYYKTVADAVAKNKTPQEAKAEIVEKYPQWGGDVLLDTFLPLFYTSDGKDAPVTKKIKLNIGEVQTFDFGVLKMHAYQANDGLGDEAILLENGKSVVLIDPPSFHEQIAELLGYIDGLGLKITDVIIAYHPFGSDQFKGAKIYIAEALAGASQKTDMGAGFATRFGDGFAKGIATEDVVLKAGKTQIGGIDMVIYPTDSGCDIAIPSINALFIHMNGGSTHSITRDLDKIADKVAVLKRYAGLGFDYILTSHDAVEPASALNDKVQYLNKVKEIANASDSADSFIAAMKKAFPDYKGEAYLKMTAAALFPQ